MNDLRERILATIRTLESGGNYRARARGSTASGAYQMLDSTWRHYARFVPGAGRYQRAADAPAALQDSVAWVMVQDILRRNGGRIEAIGPSWYVGRYDPTNMDYVPKPEAGNRLTVREYQQRWMQVFNRTPASPSSGGGQAMVWREGVKVPAELARFGSGRIPPELLTSVGLGGHKLYGPAAAAFIQLRRAAGRAGINLTLTDSYRSFSQQAEGHRRKPGVVAPAGKSVHGFGLAVDLAEGWPPRPLSARARQWLQENAWLYGWRNSVPREPWHYVYVGDSEDTTSIKATYAPTEAAVAEPMSAPAEVYPETTVRDSRIKAGWGIERLARLRMTVAPEDQQVG